ncbi:MAG: hypothetical protein ACQCN3_06310 [Candidatus Bathyarchaeia archaeon]|jgi:hypothetical protein
MPVPEAYYNFVMEYAPYLYVTPSSGPDLTWGKATLAGAFAIDFLYDAYFDDQFDGQSGEIEAKIVQLANWILTQQNLDTQNQAYGGFKSAEASTTYYSTDAARTLPALLKAYELTSNTTYLDGAKTAALFLYNMQHRPSEIGVHNQYYGGFARAVDSSGVWQPQMDIEVLYGLIGLKMLCEVDPSNQVVYEAIMADAVQFYRLGIEGAHLFFDPLPLGDGNWHRVGTNDDTIYDDSLAYALLGLYDNEGYSPTVQKAYETLNAIGASPIYPAYNPAVCWAGYLNVPEKSVACDYYDGVTAGILGKIRKNHDKISYNFSVKVVTAHPDEFMFWGIKHADYTYLENTYALASICWLGELLLNYEPQITRFTQILNAKGENLSLQPILQTDENSQYGSTVDFAAVVLPAKVEETLIEPGYIVNDYLTLHTFTPIRRHDKVCRKGADYEVLTVQDFTFRNQTVFLKATLRRLQN